MLITLAKLNFQRAGEASLGDVFRQILKDKNFSALELEQKTINHVRAHAPAGTSDEKLDMLYNNLRNSLSQNEMSWKTFCEAMQVIGVEEISMLI